RRDAEWVERRRETTPVTAHQEQESSHASAQPILRRAAAVTSLAFGYSSTALMMIRGLVLPPIIVHYVPNRLYGIWLASSSVISWIMMSEGGSWLLLRQQAAQ